MQRSKIKLHKRATGFYLMASSKKGVSADQLHRTLDIGYEAAWFMAHRIREAMRAGGLAPLGGEGKIVEADDTYHGKVDSPKSRSRGRTPKPTKGWRSGPADKRAIMALVERGGSVRTFHAALADKETLTKIITENVARQSRLHTDESRLYGDVLKHVANHETVKHSAKEYVPDKIHTKVVDADRAYLGKVEKPIPSQGRKRRPYLKLELAEPKGPIVALVESRGDVRAAHMPLVTPESMRNSIVRAAHRNSRVHTDDSQLYMKLGGEFAERETVHHSSKEDVRDDVTTDTVERFFGVLKRGMKGIHPYCREQQFQHYTGEFQFRYNQRGKLGVDDVQRAPPSRYAG